MAGLVLGVVGAAIMGPAGFGFAGFMGMSGASIGFSLGSMLGNTLFAPSMPNINQQGPRLGDLKVQSSTYGNPIPIVYGALRVAGNVIWSMDVVETPHTTTQSGGGKGGGGGGSVTQTSYTYSQSFAVAVCEGTIAGVRKIWANGKLIYNLSDTADIATVIASNKSAAGIRIYTGSETQTADSLIQANIGAADTPAYRGMAYVVFENLQLADFGNRTPNLEFEVVTAGSYAHFAGEHVDYASSGADAREPTFDSATNSIWVANYRSASISKFNVLTGARIDYASGSYPLSIAFDSTSNSIWVIYASIPTISKFNVFTGARTDYATAGNESRGVAFDGATNSIWVANYGIPTISKFNVLTGARIDYASGSYPLSIAFDSTSNSIWVIYASIPTISKFNVFTGARTDYATAGNESRGVAFDSATNSVWVTNYSNATISKFNVFTGARIDYAVSGNPWGVAFDSATNSVWVTNYSNATISKVNVFTGTRVDYNVGANPSGVAFDSKTDSVWAVKVGANAVLKIDIADYGMQSTAPALSSIVSNICTRAGLATGQIDVTALTDTVDGYVVQRSTARAQIEQLMQAFYFDAVESDGKVKFVKRGGSAAVAIPEDDLAAHEYGSTPPTTLITARKQEMELPVEMNVQYMDKSAAYAIGTQRSRRLTTDSENKASLNLAISMSASKAKQIVDVLMYDAWTGRTTFDQAHGWKYSYLEPTDLISVTNSGRTYAMRIVDEDASGGIYSRKAVLEDINVYTQSGTAAGLPIPDGTVSIAPLTDLQLLDIPLLRDQDDGYGFYSAACGFSSGWHGAQTFKSNDGGATWSSYGSGLLNAATIGGTSTALGNFYSGNIFDETNSVTVVLINGTLSSDTELNVLNGANVALLGNEIIQFKNATLTATSTYTLSGLLRGRQGTEWAMTTHAAGDRFVLLSSTTTYLFPASSAEYNLARKYRGVSIGGFLADATTIDFTNTAVAQTPYAPVQLGGGRNAALNVVLNWIRRTRLSGSWNNYADVPLGESTEAYVVEIWNAGYTVLKRTISGLTSPTTTYTAAQQTTDFGSTQSTVYWKVFQVSATVGNGYEARGVT